MVLPRYAAIKSQYSNKYLRYVNEDVQIHGFLQYSGEAVVTAYTKFEIEAAKTGKGHVHIRCVYNNKYWVRWNDNSNYMVAGGDEPEEDQTKWSCTLFEPDPDSSRDAYRFLHVQLKTFVRHWNTSGQFAFTLFANEATSLTNSVYYATVIDWDSLCILPKYVAFKGDNGAYLKCYNYKNMKYLQFGTNSITDALAGHEVFPMNDGSVRIKSTYWNYWRRDPDWIKADSTDVNAKNPNDLFWPVSLGGNVIALRSLGNNAYCKRLTKDGKTSFLNAGTSTITEHARMEVEELVTSREIYNCQFHLADARIYGEEILDMATKDGVNNTTATNQITLTLAYENSSSSTWNNTTGASLTESITIKSGIPIIAEGEIQIYGELYGAYSWGKTITETSTVEASYTATVPPMSKVKVSMLATKGQCDIPFTYLQRDTLVDGKVVISQGEDGIYTGVNCYNFKFHATTPTRL